MANRNGSNIESIVVLAFVILGAIHWGLIGFLNFHRVDAIFGGGWREETSALSRVVYVIVDIAGVWAILSLLRLRHAPHGEIRPAITHA